LRDSASGYTGTLYSAQAGNGQWTSWLPDSNAAPNQFYQPSLLAHAAQAQTLVIRWFAPQHIGFDLEETESLLSPITWSPIPDATNLVATDTNLEATIDASTTNQRFLRVRGIPKR